MNLLRLAGSVAMVVLTASLGAKGIAAQSLTADAALLRLCSAPTVSPEWFAPEFLARVPIPFAAVQQQFSVLREEFGRCLRVASVGSSYDIIYEHGVATVTSVRLDGQSRFQSLFAGHIYRTFTGLDVAGASFSTLPGLVSVLVVENGRTQLAVNADTPLAIGSAFKLSVLTALREQIEAGKHTWSETLSVRPEWKSLPSGLLQQFPDNTVLSLRTLAQLMIAVSDNTATDMLIRLVGRESVEAKAPPRNRPLLMTREAFILKDPRNADLLGRWRTSHEQDRRLILEEIRIRPLPDLVSFGALLQRGPVAPDVEWFYTPRELCTLIDGVSDLSAMRINPGLAIRKDWTWVAFKGGSEPGVLNLTTELERADGRRSCVSATWNSATNLEGVRLIARYTGLLELLK